MSRRDVEREREQDFRVAVARPVTVARTILAERRIPSKRSTTSGGGSSLTQGRVTQRCKHARENCQKAVGSSPSLLSTSEAVEGARSARRCEKYEIRAAVRCPKYILRSWRKNGEGEGNEVDRVSLSLSLELKNRWADLLLLLYAERGASLERTRYRTVEKRGRKDPRGP